MALPDDATLIEAMTSAAIAAGDVILAARRAGLTVEKKSDASPVTDADRAAEVLIAARLAAIAPTVPMIGEEGVSEGRVPDPGDVFFLVDPLDGTREFVKGGNDFTVNIGVIRNGRPEIGIIYVPASAKLFGGVVGEGAWRTEVVNGTPGPRRAMQVRPAPAGAIDVVASRSHRTPETDAFIRRFDVANLINRGSSLKFCAVAEGKADLYPRMGTTMQWDTAAGEAILTAAGGRVVQLDGRPLFYGRGPAAGPEAFRNPWFVAAGSVEPLPG